jgi:L-fucose mutarotase
VPEICEKYQEIIDRYEPGFDISPLKKADFYERSSNAVLILRTGERRKFGNLILRKGVVSS